MVWMVKEAGLRTSPAAVSVELLAFLVVSAVGMTSIPPLQGRGSA
jgi:hypothetical protein